ALALSARVGSPFGPEAAGRWLAVRELLPKVRAWLAGEVLEVVFEHLRPEVAGHQLEARKQFWKGYTGSVVRVWIAVSSAIKRRRALDHPQVREIRAAMGADLKILDLDGTVEQALVWMHLQGRDGQVVTVIEGNANTTLRMREGEFTPTFSFVDYRGEVVNGPIAMGGSSSANITHHTSWPYQARQFLAPRGIVPA
ncbi:MAG: Signature domain, partial [Pseudomonadota bacterium]